MGDKAGVGCAFRPCARLRISAGRPAPLEGVWIFAWFHLGDMSTQPFSTDLSDAEWQILGPLLASSTRRGRPRKHARRTMLDAMLYVLRSAGRSELMEEIVRLRAQKQEAEVLSAMLEHEFERTLNRMAEAEGNDQILEEKLAFMRERLSTLEGEESYPNGDLHIKRARIGDLEEQLTRVEQRIRVLERVESAANAYERAYTEAQLRISELEAFEQRAKEAEERVRILEKDLARSGKVRNSLFRRVGLDEDCPNFVLQAVRRSYRKQLHPDTKATQHKGAAEMEFKEAEEVFDALYKLRGL